MIYLLPLILILFGVVRYDYLSGKRGRLFLIFLLYIALVCIAGFRFRLGGDTVVYTNYFEHLPEIDKLRSIDLNRSRYAPGFIILLSLSKTIYNEFFFFQFIVSIFINTAVFLFFFKNSKHFFFGILLYYFYFYTELNMEVLRETVAISIFLFAWPYFKEGKWIQYYILAILAIFFHMSAFMLILLPLICLPGINYIFTFGRRTFFFCLVIFILGVSMNIYFTNFMEIIALTEKMSDVATTYSKNSMGGSRMLNINGIISIIIRLILYPCLALYFLNSKYKEKLREMNGLIKAERITVLSLYIAVGSMTVIILFRFNNYLAFFPLLLISDWVFSSLQFKMKRIRLGLGTWFLIVLPMFLMQFYSLYYYRYTDNGSYISYMKYYPYQSIFDKEKDIEREHIYRKIRRYGW